MRCVWLADRRTLEGLNVWAWGRCLARVTSRVHPNPALQITLVKHVLRRRDGFFLSDIPISIPTAGIGLKAAQAGVFVERLVPGRSADKVGLLQWPAAARALPELSTAHFFIVAVFHDGHCTANILLFRLYLFRLTRAFSKQDGRLHAGDKIVCTSRF
jgi:hypothetical protein